MANSVVHFEIFASDVERARKFYERVFGWKFEAAGPPDFYLSPRASTPIPASGMAFWRNAAVRPRQGCAERVSGHDQSALDHGRYGCY